MNYIKDLKSYTDSETIILWSSIEINLGVSPAFSQKRPLSSIDQLLNALSLQRLTFRKPTQ